MRFAGRFLALGVCVAVPSFAQLAPVDPNRPEPPPAAPTVATEPEPAPPPPPPPTAPAPAPPPAVPQPAPAQPPPGPYAPYPPYPPPPPGYYYGQPAQPGWTPPPPPPNRSEHRHDGFYLRMGVGLAQGHATTETEDDPAFKATFDGWGPAYELLIGGTIATGFVIGGGFVAQDISEPDVTVEPDAAIADDIDTSGSLGLLVLGPFVDWFFDETQGFHAGLVLGLGSIGLRDENDEASSGLGASVFAGYDFWVAKQWSLGVEGRALYVSSDRNFGDSQFEDRARGFQLLFTALLH